ncbi:sodium/calcium exchanger NCL2-like isoform X2 [Durio zibethinus]|uniref:Sodium/calcium exchanger NCL2-like isoform X2 n=1 Tax=Durio zibethinus TaxID=66656 RepID=A0A6P5XZK0_DURZI|nr:sodium/calcium exchanger NCL2-like isoform X2 [Durio zibethinus]
MRNIAKTIHFLPALFIVIIVVKARPLPQTSLQLVSDGIDHVQANHSSKLFLKETGSSSECEQMYGFLPCSNSIYGHLFLILVYEYLLFHGESYLASGGEQIFKILGPGFFGASAFHILGALPEALILLGFGITTDQETSYTARIMVFSVTPFLIIQLLKIIPSSSAKTPVILIALTISVLFLLLFFCYQIFQPWIQKRRLEFVKHEDLILRILQHVQKHAIERILTHVGAPNVNAIRRLFEELDQDGNDYISPSELKELLLEVKFTRSHINKEKAIEDVMKEFDLDGDQKITKDEFINGFTKWLDEAKKAMDKRYYSQKSLRDIYRVFQPWIENKRKEREMKKNLISEMLSHFESNSVGSLLTDDGKPDKPAIIR